MEVKLIVQNGKQAGRAIRIAAAKFVIGRAEDCQLRVQSNLISRKHCMILIEDASATVEDCGSTNGTFLNDQRITERQELHSGDRLRVGMLGLEVQLAVSVEAKRKPKVHSVQEAAARTAASTPAAQEDLDISGWLGENGGPAPTPPRPEPPSAHETIADKSLVDTATMPAEGPKPDEKQSADKKQQKTHGPSKGVSKFHAPAKPKAETSGAAADDALRQFFHRKK
jgi:pSer/pThr/pTyr-binding forkhead associated (FHA) protein